jgi:hypothetical protein
MPMTNAAAVDVVPGPRDEIRAAIGTTLEAFQIDHDDLAPGERRCLRNLDREIEPIARERVEALAKVIAWAGTNEFESRTGTFYRKECRHDNECPTIDWSDWDDHVVPIYLYVNGENFAFVIDVMVHQQGHGSFAAVTDASPVKMDLQTVLLIVTGIVTAASAVVASTPTPPPGSTWATVYKSWRSS